MSPAESASKHLSVVDSALLLAMLSAVCYVMGYSARVGVAHAMRVPINLFPPVKAEDVILVGGMYLGLILTLLLLLYFLGYMLASRVARWPAWMTAAGGGLRQRTSQFPLVYALIAFLLLIATIYTVPRLVPVFPRHSGWMGTVAGKVDYDITAIRFTSPEDPMQRRKLRYLWRLQDALLLQDQDSGETLIIKLDQVEMLSISAVKRGASNETPTVPE